MPIYNYICDNCSNNSNIEHSINEKITECPHCGTQNSMRKQLSEITIVKNKITINGKPGELVKQTIVESKKEIEEEKERLKSKVWSPNK